MRPTSGFGATPIEPKNGARRSVMPGANVAVPARGSKRTRWNPTYGNSSGSVPPPGMKPLTPYGWRNSKLTIFTSSESPGSAPSIQIGPVIGCAPGPRSVTARSTAFSASGISSSLTPAARNRCRPRAIIDSTRTVSPEPMRRTGFTEGS